MLAAASRAGSSCWPGPGNNGGDAFVCARASARARFRRRRRVAPATPRACRRDAAAAWTGVAADAARASSVRRPPTDAGADRRRPVRRRPDAARSRAPYAAWVEWANASGSADPGARRSVADSTPAPASRTRRRSRATRDGDVHRAEARPADLRRTRPLRRDLACIALGLDERISAHRRAPRVAAAAARAAGDPRAARAQRAQGNVRPRVRRRRRRRAGRRGAARRPRRAAPRAPAGSSSASPRATRRSSIGARPS